MDKEYIRKDHSNKAMKILLERINEEYIDNLVPTINNINENIINNIKDQQELDKKKKKRIQDRKVI